jgi:hypothetical protein
MMDRIYQRAQQVIVWLGDVDECTELAFTHAQTLAGAEMEEGDKSWRNGRAAVAPFDTPLIACSQRQWFTCVWVIQEVCPNAQFMVQCGKYQIYWTDLDHAVRLALVADRLPLHTALFEFRRGFLGGSKSDIASLVVRFQGCQAAQPPDKIFALAGLLGKDAELGVVIHYGMSKAQLYTNWTLACLNRTLSLDLIGSIDKDVDHTTLNNNSNTEYLPS